MDNLYIDYEQGYILGNKIQEEAKVLNSLINRIKDIQLRINEKVNNEFSKELEVKTEIISKLSDVVEETGDFLVNVSNAYILTEKSGKFE